MPKHRVLAVLEYCICWEISKVPCHHRLHHLLLSMAGAAAAVAVHHLLSPPSLSLSYLKPFLRTTVPTFLSPRRLFCAPSASLAHLEIPSPLDFHPSNTHIEEEDEETEDSQQRQPLEEEAVVVGAEIPIKADSSKVPKLSVKEKKELAAYAHSLGKKLKSQQVGKSGVTSSVATSFVETLEANELLKLKVHNSCPGELPDVVRQLEEATGSVAVGQIGRAVILYRPSISKLKAAEKKKQHVPRIRKSFQLKPAEPKGHVLRLSGRGRRGSSRLKQIDSSHATEMKR